MRAGAQPGLSSTFPKCTGAGTGERRDMVGRLRCTHVGVAMAWWLWSVTFRVCSPSVTRMFTRPIAAREAPVGRLASLVYQRAA